MEANMTAELIFAAGNIIGESLVWDDPQKRLLWVDIIGKSIHALAPKTFDHHSAVTRAILLHPSDSGRMAARL